LDNREVDVTFDAVALLPLVSSGNARVQPSLQLVVNGLVGDQPHRAGLRTSAEQCPLRSRQHLDAREVGSIDVEISAAGTDRLLVQVEGNVRHRGADFY